jgi:hypothetical protein
MTSRRKRYLNGAAGALGGHAERKCLPQESKVVDPGAITNLDDSSDKTGDSEN